jgi:hypothetical protein
MLCVVLLNETPADHSPLAALMTSPWLAGAAADLQKQLQRDVARFWPYAQDGVVRPGSGPSDVGATECPARIIPVLDVQGAIAYHDDANGYPDVFLGSDTCSTLDDVTSALSHENTEICGDPNCDQWVTVPSGIALPQGLVAGMQIAQETDDPLQDRTYRIGNTLVADFVLPAYFDLSISGPTSLGELLGGPRLEPFNRTPGGYQLVRNADGSGETQAFGFMSEHRKMKARASGSRQRRRGLRLKP